MAYSLSHKFGQIIGGILESAIEPRLQAFADEHDLYLDKKGDRPARSGKKVAWEDEFGNKHDLDFVLEKGGTDNEIGTPIAFIESAWRRYTRHSRNKAQEIQGAILPLFTTHRFSCPFIGVVVAGEFTEGAITQLKSRGFSVLYFPYGTVVEAFAEAGIDAAFGEDTTEAAIQAKVDAFTALTADQKQQIKDALVRINSVSFDSFIASLRSSVERTIETVIVSPLHGSSTSLGSINDAIHFIEDYDQANGEHPFVRYVILIRYNNGDKIEGEFNDKASSTGFLRNYLPANFQPAN